jgi:hypothetical protein
MELAWCNPWASSQDTSKQEMGLTDFSNYNQRTVDKYHPND